MTIRVSSALSVVRRLLSFSVQVRRTVFASMVLRIVNQGLGITLLAYAGIVLGERIVGATPVTPVGRVVVVLGVGAAVKAVARYLEQFTGHWAAFRVLGLLRARVYDHLQAHAARVSSEERTGDLVSRVMADVDRTEVFFAHTLAPAVAALVLGVGSIVAMTVLAGPAPAAVLALSLVCVAAGWPSVVARFSTAVDSESRTVLGRMNAQIVDTILGIREILAYRVDATGRIDDSSRRYDDLQRRRARIVGIGDAMNDLTIAIALVGVVVVARPAAIPVALALAAGAFGPALAFSLVFADAGVTLSSARRVFGLFDEYPVPEKATDASHPGPAGRSSENGRLPGFGFADVWFAYGSTSDADPPAWVHTGLSFTVRPGELTVVIGPSGCGKSTIVPLVLRWYTPQRGRITWEHGAPSSVEKIAVMPQNSFVLRGTLRDNLLIAQPDATDDELRRACADASLEEWLATLPRGLDTELGVSVTTISGGERRRLALARLALRDATLQILDEPTAHLDTDNASAVREWIVKSSATRIVITHDEELIKCADRVVTMRDGAAVDEAVTTSGRD